MITRSSHFLARTVSCTALALIAFAANSVLCRSALGGGAIDAAGFTVIRLLSGTLVLAAILRIRNHAGARAGGSWISGLTLFIYAVSFSFAYITLHTGTGALILFGSVQVTMILLALASGDRLHLMEWAGVTLALAGFVYLMLPGVAAPSTMGFLLMTVAGIAWGVYTLRGRSSNDPLRDTAWNFSRTIPFAAILALAGAAHAHYSAGGIALAVLSGGIASGIGYAIWYSALGGLTATQAAVVQLLVPVIAALGGVLFLSETVTLRLIMSAIAILGGILLVIAGRFQGIRPRSPGAPPQSAGEGPDGG